jgi:hypothetical protein
MASLPLPDSGFLLVPLALVIKSRFRYSIQQLLCSCIQLLSSSVAETRALYWSDTKQLPSYNCLLRGRYRATGAYVNVIISYVLIFRLTDSLWRRQSQQSFNTLTPFNFLLYSLHVSAPTGHPQVRYTISYYFCFWRTILIQRIRCTYAIW